MMGRGWQDCPRSLLRGALPRSGEAQSAIAVTSIPKLMKIRNPGYGPRSKTLDEDGHWDQDLISRLFSLMSILQIEWSNIDNF